MSKVIRKRCAKCKFRINEESQTCSNDACPNQGQQHQATEGFELLVDISDHTGTLHSCNLAGTVAEKTLGCKVSKSNTYIIAKSRLCMYIYQITKCLTN
ncbi:hypothetical protein cypCar_00008219 [Cyprinus carpio]|nr:hypothetical protein cypCar_00008219 [Cyprinus carpio]